MDQQDTNSGYWATELINWNNRNADKSFAYVVRSKAANDKPGHQGTHSYAITKSHDALCIVEPMFYKVFW